MAIPFFMNQDGEGDGAVGVGVSVTAGAHADGGGGRSRSGSMSTTTIQVVNVQAPAPRDGRMKIQVVFKTAKRARARARATPELRRRSSTVVVTCACDGDKAQAQELDGLELSLINDNSDGVTGEVDELPPINSEAVISSSSSSTSVPRSALNQHCSANTRRVPDINITPDRANHQDGHDPDSSFADIGRELREIADSYKFECGEPERQEVGHAKKSSVSPHPHRSVLRPCWGNQLLQLQSAIGTSFPLLAGGLLGLGIVAAAGIHCTGR